MEVLKALAGVTACLQVVGLVEDSLKVMLQVVGGRDSTEAPAVRSELVKATVFGGVVRGTLTMVNAAVDLDPVLPGDGPTALRTVGGHTDPSWSSLSTF